jgi:hypothetical protein
LAEIAYAYLPASAVNRIGISFRNSGGAGSVNYPGSRKVLQGFRVAFDRGDRPLQRFTIDLNTGLRLRLTDGDAAEPINWTVDWVELVD